MTTHTLTTHTLTITVTTPDEISAETVREHLMQMLSIGQDDAVDAQHDDDLTDYQRQRAEQAANLEYEIETKS